MPTGYPDYLMFPLGIFPVSSGGTGNNQFTQNGVILGNGTGVLNATAAGTSRQILQVPAGGGAPQFQDADVNTLDVHPTGVGGITMHCSTGANPNAGQYELYDDSAGVHRAFFAMAAVATNYFSDTVAGDIIVRALSNTLRLGQGSGASALQIFGQNLSITGYCTSYNGRATAGYGLAPVLFYSSTTYSGSTSYTVTLFGSNPDLSNYRLSGYLLETTAGGTGNMSLAVNYWNGYANRTITFAPAVATGAAGVDTQGSIIFRVTAGSACSVTITTNNATATFYCFLTLERLGY